MLTEPGAGRPWSTTALESVEGRGAASCWASISAAPRRRRWSWTPRTRCSAAPSGPPTGGAPVRVAVEVARAAMSAADLPMTSLRAVGRARCPGDVDARTGTVRLAVNLDALDLPLARPARPGAGRALLRGARRPRGRGHVARRPPGRDRRPGLPEHRHRDRGGCRAGRAAARRRQRPGRRDRSLRGRPGRPDVPLRPARLPGGDRVRPGRGRSPHRTALDAGEASSLRDLAPTSVPITAGGGRTRPPSGATRWRSG